MGLEDDPEYLEVLKKAKEWESRGVVAPMACSEALEPIFDADLPLGSTILIPAFNQGYDHCTLQKDAEGFYAQSEYAETYRLAFGPNWYLTSELPPQY